MKVLMIKEAKGSDRDAAGIAMPVKTYLAKQEYEMGEDLASVFIEIGVAKKAEPEIAEPLKPEPAQKQKRGKMKLGAPENKGAE